MGDNTTRIGKYLRVQRLVRPAGRTTDRWHVLSNYGDVLGSIQWFGRWRQYTFDPSPHTTFNDACLVDITTFLRGVNRAHKSVRRPANGGSDAG